MGFSALRHQFGKHVGEEFSEKRPVVGISADVLSKVMSPITNASHGHSIAVPAEGMEHDGQQ